MTALDVAVIILLLVIAAGGYQQGLIRGLMRTAALSAIGLIGATFSLGLAIDGSLQAVLLRVVALFGGIVCLVSATAWLINRLIPPTFHYSRLNRVLGVIPALVQGFLVLTLALGLFHRLAFEQETQQYIASGFITGRLIQPVSWLERSIAGVR